MKLPIRITITTVFALFAVVSISLVAGVNFFGGRDTILETARSDIAKSTKDAQTSIDRLVGQAFAASSTVTRLPGEMFDWRSPEAILSAFTLGLRNAPQLYGIFIGFPDGAFVQAINLIGPEGRRRKVAGIPNSAVICWRVMQPVENGKHLATCSPSAPMGRIEVIA